jgi:hypothetical protein
MALRPDGLTLAVATLASRLTRGPRLSCPATGFTCLLAPDADPGLQTTKRLVEADRDLMLQIIAPLWLATRRLTAEELAEDVAEVGRTRTRKIESLESEVPIGIRFLLFEYALGVEAINVVKLPLQRITQDFISLGNPFETIFGVAITAGPIFEKLS